MIQIRHDAIHNRRSHVSFQRQWFAGTEPNLASLLDSEAAVTYVLRQAEN